jgi:hypothetical protein
LTAYIRRLLQRTGQHGAALFLAAWIGAQWSIPASRWSARIKIAPFARLKRRSPVGARLPAIWRAAAAKPANRLRMTHQGGWVYDNFIADRGQTRSYGLRPESSVRLGLAQPLLLSIHVQPDFTAGGSGGSTTITALTGTGRIRLQRHRSRLATHKKEQAKAPGTERFRAPFFCFQKT